MPIPTAILKAFFEALESLNFEKIKTLLCKHPLLVSIKVEPYEPDKNLAIFKVPKNPLDLAIFEVPKNPTEEFFKLIFDETYNTSLNPIQKHGFFEEFFLRLAQTNKLEVIESIFANPKYELDINSFTFNGMPFIFYATYNDSKFLELLLKLGVNIETVFKDFTSLAVAAFLGKADIINMLLEHGANIEAKGKENFTALIAAAQNGQAECIKRLLAAGANTEAKNKQGLTALIMASNAGHIECTEILLAAGANIEANGKEGWTALHVACSKGHIKCVEKLLAAGANIEAKGKENFTALIIAGREGHVECVEKLLAAGANIEAKSNKGYNALVAAVDSGHVECVEKLLAAGTNPAVVNDNGFNILMLAVINGQVDIVKLLLKGVSLEYINKKDISEGMKGCSVLHTAAFYGKVKILKHLLAAGADINNPDLEGVPPIFDAITNSSFEAVEYLIKAGADLTITNNAGYNILAFAHNQNKPEIADYITKNITDNNLLLKLKSEAIWPLLSRYATTDIGIKYLEEITAAIEYSSIFNPAFLMLPIIYAYFPDKLDYKKAKFYWEKSKYIRPMSSDTDSHTEILQIQLLEAVFQYEEATGLTCFKTISILMALYEALNHVIETGNLFKLKPREINKFAELAQILSYAPIGKKEFSVALEYINDYVKLRDFALEVTVIKEEINTLSKKHAKKACDIKEQLVQKCNEHKALLKGSEFSEIVNEIFENLTAINNKLATLKLAKADFSPFKPKPQAIAASTVTKIISTPSEINDLEDLDFTVANLRKYIDKKKTAPTSLLVKYFDTATGYSSEKSKFSSADNYPEIFAKLFEQHKADKTPSVGITALSKAIKTGIDPLFLKKFLENSQDSALTKIVKELQTIQIQQSFGREGFSFASSSTVTIGEKEDKSFVTALPKFLDKDSQETLEKLIDPSQRIKLTTTDFEKLFSDLGHEFSVRKGDHDWVFINNDLVKDYIVSGINPNSSGAVTHKPHGHCEVLHPRFFCDMLKLLESTGVISKTLKPASGAGAAAISEYSIMIPKERATILEKSPAAAGAGEAASECDIASTSSMDSYASSASIIPEVFTSEEAPLSDYECMKLSLAGDC